MSEIPIGRGFEDVWRPAIRPRARRPETVLTAQEDHRRSGKARLARVALRAPEVMVKVTGKLRDAGHVKAHLDYISRRGALEMEGPEQARLGGRGDFVELAEDWSQLADLAGRRRDAPVGVSLILSMPAGTSPVAVRDAGRAFADQAFGDRFDYVFALHTDAPHPHVHIAVSALGRGGERLGPKKADLEAWRQIFAQALRDRGVAAEATPRRARGVVRKAERIPLRKLRDRRATQGGDLPETGKAAWRDAGRSAFGDTPPAPWDRAIARRQARIRAAYLAQARLLRASSDPTDRALGAQVEAFVRGMPEPVTARQNLARQLRAANARLQPSEPDPSRRDRPKDKA